MNFTSLGYGDIVMSKEWKLLGPLEAVNGVLMLGMTAAALMAILQHMIKLQRASTESRLIGRSYDRGEGSNMKQRRLIFAALRCLLRPAWPKRRAMRRPMAWTVVTTGAITARTAGT